MKGPTYKRCYESHPPLAIGEYFIYGGSCAHPVIKDADVYIGFDSMMAKTDRRFPWVEGEEFLFPIIDRSCPPAPAKFAKMIEWISEQLISQKKIHMGCIGGHGRTGLVLAALVSYMTDINDQIAYVRKNYCEKAIESQVQVDFLVKHWGCLSAEPRKYSGGWAKPIKQAGGGALGGRYTSSTKPSATKAVSKGTVTKTSCQPATHASSIWGSGVIFDKLV